MTVAMRRYTLRPLALGLTIAVAAVTLVSTGGASAAPSSAGLAAGDYVATVKIVAVGAAVVAGEIDQQIGGTGTPQRVAQFHATSAGSTITAQVRATGPTDIFQAVTWGAANVSAFSFTPANFNYLV